MDENRIKLAVLWGVVMFLYLLGDVLRMYAGDFKAEQLEGTPMGRQVYLVIAVMQMMPILMMYFSVAVGYPVIRWMNIVVAGFFLLFNLVGIGSYEGLYDKFLLAVSMVFNGVTIWTAWQWIEV